MHNDSLHICESSLEDSQTLLFLDRLVREDRHKGFMWNISDKSVIWDDIELLKIYLKNDWGEHKIYSAYSGKVRLGLFGMLNVSEAHESANLIIWIDQSIRNNILLMRWWVYFLLEAQGTNILNLYAKIRRKNIISLMSAKRYGFLECKFVPEYLKSDGESQETCCVTRKTNLNTFEEKYVFRYLKRAG